MKVPFVDLARRDIETAVEAEALVRDVLTSGVHVLGERGAALESAIAAYVGTGHGAGCNSGTDALHLALRALGVGPGDEVISTPFTFAATLEAIEHAGAVAVLVDIDPRTFNLDACAIEAAITSHTRALLPVHLFGLPADMDAIMGVAARHGLWVIEDCAQALGAALDGRRVGGIGHAGALSFYPTKTLGGAGDGGMVVTRDAGVARRVRRLRHHGADEHGEHVELGFNSRLDELQAGLLLARLRRLDENNERRRRIAARYDNALASTRARVPVVTPGAHHVYGCYTILVHDRDALQVRLGEAGICAAMYYRKPLHRHPHFSRSCRFGDLPVAEDVARRCLSLPVFPMLTDEEVEYVASTAARMLS